MLNDVAQFQTPADTAWEANSEPLQNKGSKRHNNFGAEYLIDELI